MLGFRETHREEVDVGDMVREALLQFGDGPNLNQLLEPLSADSPVQKRNCCIRTQSRSAGPDAGAGLILTTTGCDLRARQPAMRLAEA